MEEDQSLLSAFSKNGDERAFGQLVERYSGLVYSVAARTLGDHDLAKDTTQMVFSILARKASALSRNQGTLPGWLHRVALLEAKNLARKERTHQKKMIAYSNQKRAERTQVKTADNEDFVALHAALDTLSSGDRSAVIMRFFNGLSFREIGERLNRSEDASQKQVSRALEVLQRSMARRGTAFSLAALGTLCSTELARAAPAGLASGITTGALTGAFICSLIRNQHFCR